MGLPRTLQEYVANWDACENGLMAYDSETIDYKATS